MTPHRAVEAETAKFGRTIPKNRGARRFRAALSQLAKVFFAKCAAILAFSTATLAKPWKECYSCVKLEAFHGRLGAK
jgi:hypothetical protein